MEDHLSSEAVRELTEAHHYLTTALTLAARHYERHHPVVTTATYHLNAIQR